MEEVTHFDIFAILQSAIPFVKVDIYTVIAGVLGISIMLMAFDYITTVLFQWGETQTGGKRDLKKIGRRIKRDGLSVERSGRRTQKTDFSDWDEEDDSIGELRMERDDDR